MIKHVFVSCTILIVVAIIKCNGEHSMKVNKIEYLVAEMEEAPQTLTIDDTGLARYASHTNSATPDLPEIGIYQTKLPGGLESLSNQFNNTSFKQLPDHWGRVLPGERYKRIRVTVGSETVEKLIGTHEPIDSRLKTLIDKLDQIVIDVSRHPYQILRIDLSQATVDPKGELTATLALSNGGIQSFLCRNPMDMMNAPDAHIKVQAWPDKPSSALRAEDVVSADISKLSDLPSPGISQLSMPVIEIPSKATASFRITSSLPLKEATGAFLVRVVYENQANPVKGHQVIYGELFSKTVRVNKSKS
jgi:hypothetical protein